MSGRPGLSPSIGRDMALEIGRLDAHGQAELVAKGELSRLELVDAAILRIEELDQPLNAVSWRAFDAARAGAETGIGDSRLAGVPYLLKDSLDYDGMPSVCGSRARRDAPPFRGGFPYARCLDAAGLVPVGKTSVPEFSLLATTEPLLRGPTRNPWDLERSPGGSSGGAAVSVASGMVPLAHAADGGGSIRIPASCCGVVGLKPGRGGNVRARAPSLVDDLLAGDTLLSRSVRDVHWATRATWRSDVMPRPIPDRRLRIAVATVNLNGERPDDAVASVVEQTARLCAELGHAVEWVPLPVDGAAVAAAFRTLWCQVARELEDAMAATGAPAVAILESWTRGLAQLGREADLLDTERVLIESARAIAALDAHFARYDIILSPVTRRPPPMLGELHPERDFGELLEAMFDYVSYTQLYNLTGMPSVSLPLFADPQGLPIGSMFSGPRGSEFILLDLAAKLEEARPWGHRWPAMSCAARKGSASAA